MRTTIKKMVALCLTIAVMSGLYCSANAQGYVTEQGYIPEDAIEHTSSGPAYKIPNDSVTTDMFATRAFGDLLYMNVTADYTNVYTYDNGHSIWYNEFVRYLTDSWAKASSYTWSKSQTINWQLTGSIEADVLRGVKAALGLSSSVTISFGYGTTIPADSSRLSKLGLSADFNAQLIRTEYWKGVLDHVDNGRIMTPKETYLLVYYQ